MNIIGYDLNYLLSQLLYIISGFCFGIFCCRYGIISLQHFKVLRKGRSTGALHIFRLLGLAILPLLLWFVAPVLMLSKTLAGAYAMFTTIIYFLHRAKRNGSI